MDRRHKVLITSTDWGVGKSIMALSYSQISSQICPDKPDILDLDYEHGQDYYVADTPEQADPSKLQFYVQRLTVPSLYEVRFLIEKIRHPDTPAKELKVFSKPCDTSLLGDKVKKMAINIQSGKLKIGTIIFDTVTRLCEQVSGKVFGDAQERMGLEKAERMTQLLWAKIKDDISEMLYTIIEEDFNLIMTSWSKNKYDVEARKSTSEIIADVLKNVNAFVDLSLMLSPNLRDIKTGTSIPPKARVIKSRLQSIPAGSIINPCTWETILSYEPHPVTNEELEVKEGV